MTNAFETITASADAIDQQTVNNETGSNNVLTFNTVENVSSVITSSPTIVAHPTSAQLDEYSAWSSKSNDAIETNVIAGQTALCTLVAFCALVHLGLGETPDERTIAGTDWAKRKSLGTVKSKYGAANTVAALLNLDVASKDKEIAKRNRSRIDRDAAAIDGVFRHLEAENLLNDRKALLGSSGMKHAITIILDRGGVESLSKEQRAYKPVVIDEETGQSYKAIELDGTKVETICSQKAEDVLSRMAGVNDGQVGIAVVNLIDGKVKGFREVFPVPAVRAIPTARSSCPARPTQQKRTRPVPSMLNFSGPTPSPSSPCSFRMKRLSPPTPKGRSVRPFFRTSPTIASRPSARTRLARL